MTNRTSFSCGENLDIAHANSMHQRLQKSLQKSAVIELKADKVSKADTAGLQLLAALAIEVTRRGGHLIWKKPSDTLLTTAQQLGLSQALMLENT
ncbi:STAS domain-containing protein [Oceanicoccus sagamiensis]|uniref:STAS domain-containing protein n=1 Tax=Oceanicoccus sagamiensis TaxID=716816 RepID=A0A1X9NM12_9GAMM|nr:STAS domain-containing protein [Oceanicoccus sagamiensis]ARN74983.1 hypothetical protein BST96_13185 [Oceanicoccus sagamiensis]